jgi:hypothetical protein
MKIVWKPANWMSFATMVVLLGWFAASPTRVQAQQEYNAVCNSSSPPPGITCTAAFLDASVAPGSDLCAKIFYVLTHSYPATGAVVDARGISGSALTCAGGAGNNSPWVQGIANTNNPSVILLPTGTINIPTTWILPPRTRIKGMGVDGQNGTLIQPSSSSFGGTAMIQFGTSSTFGISVEDLTLSGAVGGTSVPGLGGIVNFYSQEQTYVKHVNLPSFAGTALQIGQSTSTSSGNSGPYENLYITGGTGPCVQIIGAETRGIHGMTCSAAEGSGAAAGVLLDAGGSTIEDVHFEVFKDGILVGANEPAASNVIFNVSGSSLSGNNMTSVVHISSANSVTDLSVMGVRAINSGGTSAPDSIKDDVTGTTLADLSVGMYALGESTAGGHTRFTTSPNAPSWVSGSGVPSGNCAVGSLYSNTAALSTTNLLYVCVAGTVSNNFVALTIP